MNFVKIIKSNWKDFNIMNNTEILNAFANLINSASTKKGIDLDLAYQNFYGFSKLNCRQATLDYYSKNYKVLKRTMNALGVFYTSEVSKIVYKQLESILRNQGYKNSSINKYTDLLKMIFKVNNDLEYIDYNPIANIKKLKEDIPEIQTISKKNMNKIMSYLETLPKTYHNIRNTSFLLLLKDTGIRLNELLHLKTKYVDIENNTIFLDFTKTHATRYVFFTDDTKIVLREYMKIKRYAKEPNIDYFFNNDTGTLPMNRNVVYHFLEDISKACHIDQSITPHKWRHTFITKLVENNVNLSSVMKVAGHTEYSTTQRYIHQNLNHLKESILSIKK